MIKGLRPSSVSELSQVGSRYLQPESMPALWHSYWLLDIIAHSFKQTATPSRIGRIVE